MAKREQPVGPLSADATGPSLGAGSDSSSNDSLALLQERSVAAEARAMERTRYGTAAPRPRPVQGWRHSKRLSDIEDDRRIGVN